MNKSVDLSLKIQRYSSSDYDTPRPAVKQHRWTHNLKMDLLIKSLVMFARRLTVNLIAALWNWINLGGGLLIHISIRNMLQSTRLWPKMCFVWVFYLDLWPIFYFLSHIVRMKYWSFNAKFHRIPSCINGWYSRGHTYTRTHARTHARTHVRTHARTHAHTHTHTHTHITDHQMFVCCYVGVPEVWGICVILGKWSNSHPCHLNCHYIF